MTDAFHAAFATLDPNVTQMVLAVPDFSVGDALRANFRCAVEGATPGQWLQYPAPIMKSYADTFFPSRARGGFVDELPGLLPVVTSWSDLAIAVCCAAMKLNQPSSQIDGPRATQDASAVLNQAATNLSGAYSRLFVETWPDFAEPYAKVDHAAALASYQAILRGSVNLHEVWYVAGLWKHPEWELYHHWIKLLALGATPAQIDALINELIGMGLTVADTVQAGAWRTFTGFFQLQPLLDFNEVVADGKDGFAGIEIVPTSMQPPLGWPPSAGPVTVPVALPLAFTEPGDDDTDAGPGVKYYQAPQPSSCFTGDTPVWLADGTTRRMGEVAIGDVVATPDGPQPVALVSAVERQGRPLVALANEPFGFTSTHPFLAGGDETSGASFLAHDPSGLRANVAIVGRVGIDPLQAGALVLTASGPAPCPSVVPRDSGERDDVLYDLILRPRPGARNAFVVGSSAGPGWVASSEIPVFEHSPGATVAFFEALVRALAPIADLAGQSSPDRARSGLDRLSRHAGQTAVPWALAHVGAEQIADGDQDAAAAPTVLAADTLHGHVAAHLDLFQGADGGFVLLASTTFDALARAVGEQLDDVTRLGWRAPGTADGDRHVLTVFRTHLDGGVPANGVELTVQWGSGVNATLPTTSGAPLAPTEPALHATHAAVHDAVVPLDGWDGAAALTFELASGTGTVLARGSVVPPKASALGSWYAVVPLVGADGEVVGDVRADLRRLSVEAHDEELHRRVGWDEARLLTFARDLGRQVGLYLEVLSSLAFRPWPGATT